MLTIALLLGLAAAAEINLVVPEGQRAAKLAEAKGLPAFAISEIDLQWIHVLAEGWAAPLTGFMTEKQYLQCMHFENLLGEDGSITPMALPINLPMTKEDKERLAGAKKVALTYEGKYVAILNEPEYYGGDYPHNKEERIHRTFGISHPEHPAIKLVLEAGEWYVGGELEVLEPILYNDGMDKYRLSPAQLKAKFAELEADAVFVFQLRNPVHNGHALLMQDTARRLKEQGYKKPVLWLSPLGGWTKDDDVPLDTRMAQHDAIIKNGIFGETPVVCAIFPSPMVYAGPREVQWHAAARMNGGATHYIVGRDPAGMKHPGDNEDMYHMWHGQTMLQLNPGLMKGLKLLPFKFATYDVKAKQMAFFDPARKEDFVSISGSKMRKLARDGETPPEGFMDPDGWRILADYYAGLAKKTDL